MTVRELKACINVDQALTFVKKLKKTEIRSLFGGRRLSILGSKDSVSINDVIYVVDKLYRSSLKGSQTLKTTEIILDHVYDLNTQAKNLLGTKVLWIRFCTAIKSFVARLFFDRDDKLAKLESDIAWRKSSLKDLHRITPRVNHPIQSPPVQAVPPTFPITTAQQNFKRNLLRFEVDRQEIDRQLQLLKTNSQEIDRQLKQFETNRREFETNRREFETNRRGIECGLQLLKTNSQETDRYLRQREGEVNRLQALPVKKLIEEIKISKSKIDSNTNLHVINHLNLARDILKSKVIKYLERESNFENLNECFEAVIEDKEELEILTRMVAKENYFNLRSFCNFLENLNWKSEEFKNETLPCLIKVAMHCDTCLISVFPVEIKGEEGLSACEISFKMEKVFGQGNFYENPLPMSPYMAQGIGLFLKYHGECYLRSFKPKNINEWNNETFGTKIKITESDNCCFPASMISPLLPHLHRVPGIISLDLENIGKKKEGCGFTDEDGSMLYLLVTHCSTLQDLRVNTSGMKGNEVVGLKDIYEKVEDNQTVPLIKSLQKEAKKVNRSA